MTLADDIHDSFNPVTESGQVASAMIDAVEAAMEKMDPAELALLLAGLGLATTDKRKGAEIVAVARQIVAAAAPLIALL
jgi:hypothetical protein